MIRIFNKELVAVENGAAKNVATVYCNSSDTKPTSDLANGSTLVEVDTGKNYLFNEATSSWVEVSGGGGGGENDFSTAEITFVNTDQGAAWVTENIFCSCLADVGDGTEITSPIFADAVYYGTPITRTVILSQGKCLLLCSETITTSGDIEAAAGGMYFVTGNCTITHNPEV